MLTHYNCIPKQKKYWIKRIPNVLIAPQISKADVGTFGIPRKYCRSLHKTPATCIGHSQNGCHLLQSITTSELVDH